MSQKKVMVIGGGSGQVPVIKKCKEYGLLTLVVSPKGPYPGIDIADRHIDEDIYEKDRLVEIGRKEHIDYVISDQSDYAVPIVAYVAEQLNLRGNPVEVAETYTFKSRFREFCRRNDIPSPKSVLVGPDGKGCESEDLRFPVVVKPADSQGSRGIAKVDRREDVAAAVGSALHYSKNGLAVVEEYFEGRELVCEGYVIDGEYHNVAFGDRVYFDVKDKFIPSKTIFPSTVDCSIKDAVLANERKIASILKPRFAIVHSEYKVNDSGEFIIIESALRGGGVYIASHLIPFSTGVDLTDVLVHSMIGDNDGALRLLSPCRNEVSEYLCFYLNRGTVTRIEGAETVKRLPGVEVAEIDSIKENDIIPEFEHKGMRKGPFIIKARDFARLSEIENRIVDTLKIEIDDEPGINWR